MAVHRVITWYREEVDVAVRLPLLATYLSHANVAGTQLYLSMTPELLADAESGLDFLVWNLVYQRCASKSSIPLRFRILSINGP